MLEHENNRRQNNEVQSFLALPSNCQNVLIRDHRDVSDYVMWPHDSD